MNYINKVILAGLLTKLVTISTGDDQYFLASIETSSSKDPITQQVLIPSKRFRAEWQRDTFFYIEGEFVAVPHELQKRFPANKTLVRARVLHPLNRSTLAAA